MLSEGTVNCVAEVEELKKGCEPSDEATGCSSCVMPEGGGRLRSGWVLSLIWFSGGLRGGDGFMGRLEDEAKRTGGGMVLRKRLTDSLEKEEQASPWAPL